MDKFPEAFDRFESDVDVDRFQSYMELSTAFRWWAGEKWIGTLRQWEAFNVEAERLGFPVPDLFREEVRERMGSGSYVGVERRNARFSRNTVAIQRGKSRPKERQHTRGGWRTT